MIDDNERKNGKEIHKGNCSYVYVIHNISLLLR